MILLTADTGRRAAHDRRSEPMPEHRRKDLRAMTMKEKLAIHREIEAENRRKLTEWLAALKKSA